MPSDTRLRYLNESARMGTMRAASEKLDVATSSVSRQLGELEKELGIPLIEKGLRVIKLTEAGEIACHYFREKQDEEEVFLSKIEELRNIRRGKIILAIGEAFITNGFSGVLQKFMHSYPGISIRVKMSGTNDSVALVRDDEAHFGLIFDLPRDPKVTARKSLAQPLLIVAHPEHEICRKKYVKLTELSKYCIGLPEDFFRIRQMIHQAEQTEGIFLEPAIVTNSMSLLIDYAKSGRGVTILPELLVEPELSQGKLKAIPLNNTILNSTKISLITRLGRQLPIGAYRLMISIEAYIQNSIVNTIQIK